MSVEGTISRAVQWRMRLVACLLLCATGLLAGANSALAHPLGNFTVNHYSRVELHGDSVRVRYVLDMAEIPSIQEMRTLDPSGDGHLSPAQSDTYARTRADAIGQQLELTVDGQQLPLETTDAVVSQPLGEGDVPLIRLEAWYRAQGHITPDVPHQATFRDRNDPARIGWRELVVQSDPGATLSNSSVPARDVSNELRSYPDDMLQHPLDRRDASWTFSVDGSADQSAGTLQSAAADRPTDPLASLVTSADLNPTVVLLALLAAAGLGGIHAASPGHGKSMMAAYIVGTRGTVWHAVVLAMSVTISHTAGVLVLGILTVIASNLILPEQLYPWLTMLSGVVVLVVGARFFILAALGRRGSSDHHHHGDGEHGHSHSHAEPHQHEHALEHDHPHPSGQPGGKELAPTWRNLAALGLAGGIVPSGSALVVLLSSVALGRLGFGLVLIVAFGVGMAVVLVSVGVLVVHAGRLMLRIFRREEGSSLQPRIAASVPIFSAVLMTMLGAAAIFEGVIQIGNPHLS